MVALNTTGILARPIVKPVCVPLEFQQFILPKLQVTPPEEEKLEELVVEEKLEQLVVEEKLEEPVVEDVEIEPTEKFEKVDEPVFVPWSPPIQVRKEVPKKKRVAKNKR